MGPPGAGKGTQAARLLRRCAGVHIASGDILRRIVEREDSDLARAARVIHEGKLIPDDVVGAIVFRELDRSEAAAGFILDGFPRNVAQARMLDEYLASRNCALTTVIALDIDDDVLVGRLSGRLTCMQCGATFHTRFQPPREPGVCDVCGSELVVREDDRPARIRLRLQLYHEKTKPLLDYYREQGLLRVVDGVGEEDAVFSRVAEAAGCLV